MHLKKNYRIDKDNYKDKNGLSLLLLLSYYYYLYYRL